MGWASAFAYDEKDSADLRRAKQAIFAIASGCCGAGCVWAAMYWAVFGWGLTAALPIAFVLIVGVALWASHRTKNHLFAVYAQIVCIMYITSFIQWSIGGVFDSGFVMAWAFSGPITALVFFSVRRSAVWFALYVINVVITVAFDDFFTSRALVVSETTQNVFFLMNLSVSSLVVFVFAGYFVLHANSERRRADALQTTLDEESAKQLGSYTLEEQLGAGGMGVVYRARHALLRRSTAIKLLAEGSSTNVERFEQEVQLTSTLNHPNIVAVYDFGHSPDGEFYYAMEHLPGIDLESLVAQYGPMDAARAVPILTQIADALDAAHHAGLVHRDIKPGNVIVSRFGKRTDVVKVLDFGLVRDVERADSLTKNNTISGTPAYMAPEVLTGLGDSAASDIYAVGVVGFFLLVGQTVFSGATTAEIAAHHIHTTPGAPSALAEVLVPEALDQVVLRCLQKAPAKRYPSAADLARALRALEAPGTWSEANAAAWWDRFDSSRAASGEAPSRGELTVELRAR